MARNDRNSGCGSCLFKTFLIVFVIAMAVNFLENGPSSTSKPINTTNPNYTTHQNQNNNQQNNQTINQTTNPTTNPTTNQTVGGQHQLPEEGWIEAQLDETERKIYDSMVSALAVGKLECQIDSVQTDGLKDKMGRVVRAVIFEHPEFFWYGGTYSYSTRTSLFGKNSSLKVKMIPYDYWTYTNDAQGYIDRLNSRVAEVAQLARAYPTQFEQVLFVHDYIVKNTDYNHEAAAETTSSVRKASSEQSYSAYGCLVNGSAVCGGYSKAFQMIMTALGIECIYIKGDSSGGLHAWNCVKLEDQYYLFDATWDDPGMTYPDGTLRYPNGVKYTYFGMTSEQFDRAHTPHDYFSFPICTATEYNYFKHEGYYLDSADLAQIDAALKKQTGTEILEIAFSDSAYAAAKAKVIENKGFRNLEALKNQRFAYGADDQNCIIRFYLNYK